MNKLFDMQLCRAKDLLPAVPKRKGYRKARYRKASLRFHSRNVKNWATKTNDEWRGIMNQNQQILNHLKEHGSITPMDALTLYGCFRLGARVYDLKTQGHDIRCTIECHRNSNGQVKRYARYWMDK